MNNYFLKIDN